MSRYYGWMDYLLLVHYLSFRHCMMMVWLQPWQWCPPSSSPHSGCTWIYDVFLNEMLDYTETAIECDKCCYGQLPRLAKETLVYTSSALPTKTKGAFIAALAGMIVDNRKNSSMVTMACENLKDLCIQCTENAECLKKLLEALQL